MSKLKPNVLYIQKNADKTTHQVWSDPTHPTSNLLNFPRPYAMLLTAQPSAGKSMTIKNILLQMAPIPKDIYILHAETFDPDATPADPFNKTVKKIREYDGVRAIYLKTLPSLQFWDQDKDKHRTLIIDDVNLKQWCGNDRKRLNLIDKYFSWLRTHRTLTIICGFQSIWQQCVPAIYRFSNIFVVWRIRDKFAQSMIGRVCGIDQDEWQALFSLCTSPYDNITIDETLNSPARLRFNLIHPIEESSDSYSNNSSSEEDE